MHLEQVRDESQQRERNKTSWKQELEKVGRKKAQKQKYKERLQRHDSMSKAVQVKIHDIHMLLQT